MERRREPCTTWRIGLVLGAAVGTAAAVPVIVETQAVAGTLAASQTAVSVATLTIVV